MSRAFKRLERVLQLESQQGFQNKAVVGGIRQFATYWVSQAREEALDEVDRALVEQVAEVLAEYNRLPGTEARTQAITNLLKQLKLRQERIRELGHLPAQPSGPSAPAAQQRRAEPARKVQVETPSSPPQQAPAPVPEPASQQPDPEGLQQPVTAIKGVGPKLAEYLERLGATTIQELLYLFPRRYDDYTLLKPINRLQYGETVTVIGTVWETRAQRMRNRQTMVRSIISDGTGTIQATWFNQPWLADKLKPNLQIVLSGTVDQFLGRLVFQNPEWEPLALEPLRTRRIVPVYPLTQGLTSYKLRDIMKAAVAEWSRRVPDPLPEPVRRRRDLFNLSQALQQIHFPDSQEALGRARQRLVFDELFLLQMGMMRQRRDWQAQPGMPLVMDEERLAQFIDTLPFALTGAQQRVIDEMAADMADGVPMNRLLQGDVGSGKTVVAAAAMLITVTAGAQAALMAPTEILAEQHYQSLNSMLAELDIKVRLLTGSTTTADKETIYSELASGEAQVVVGTHALIQEGVQFKWLGLAVIDEQHRFGVDQRAALRDKGPLAGDAKINPHLLVMSATPIPRTLALSMYSDLDLSILDEMPPGRQEIKTRWLHPRERERAFVFLRGQIEKGRQAFIIYPLVEESDKIDAKAAVEEYTLLQEEVFPDLKLGLLHGRMKSAEKEAAMRDFYEGKSQILVSTSVIEVGVDVPNSTIMVIEGANRFGLAQLHQFRGRVGRGAHQSYCLLIADSSNGDTEERLRALEQTSDGFILAEKDLELRGPGEFFGRKQSGLPELQLASLMDMESLVAAREEAEKIFQEDPLLEQPGHQTLFERVKKFWQQAGDLS